MAISRSERQSAISKIIAEIEINTQNELVLELNKRGYNVTQATVSRDINDMGLVKVAGKEKKFRYALHNSDQKLNKLSTLFKESVVSMDTAMNLIVIKTYNGSANAACLLLDKLNLPNIVGTLAGDDTIVVIAKNLEDVPVIYGTLKEYL
ncbi:MAG: arginine repressor [Christensenellales bacterium]